MVACAMIPCGVIAMLITRKLQSLRRDIHNKIRRKKSIEALENNKRGNFVGFLGDK